MLIVNVCIYIDKIITLDMQQGYQNVFLIVFVLKTEIPASFSGIKQALVVILAITGLNKVIKLVYFVCRKP